MKSGFTIGSAKTVFADTASRAVFARLRGNPLPQVPRHPAGLHSRRSRSRRWSSATRMLPSSSATRRCSRSRTVPPSGTDRPLCTGTISPTRGTPAPVYRGSCCGLGRAAGRAWLKPHHRAATYRRFEPIPHERPRQPRQLWSANGPHAHRPAGHDHPHDYLTRNIHCALDEDCVRAIRHTFRQFAAELGVLPPLPGPRFLLETTVIFTSTATSSVRRTSYFNMIRAAAVLLAAHSAAIDVAGFFAQSAAPPGAHPNLFLRFLSLHFGLLGLLMVSTVDSSFVPLPLPGVTDIMVIVMAARHQNWFLLILLATIGSALGGYFSYQVGHSGGMAFLEKRVPPRIFKRVTHWMRRDHCHPRQIALPAILPPPPPLSPFCARRGRASTCIAQKFPNHLPPSATLPSATPSAAWHRHPLWPHGHPSLEQHHLPTATQHPSSSFSGPRHDRAQLRPMASGDSTRPLARSRSILLQASRPPKPQSDRQ